jgi:nicotinic acid mononucleotide adenylyltransferase
MDTLKTPEPEPFEKQPATTGQNINTMIFSSARMNPPTPGHLHLIDTLVETAKSNNVTTVYLILSTTHDCENPLGCEEEKKFFLRTMIENSRNYGDVNIKIICGNPFTSVGKIIMSEYNKPENSGLNLTMVVGSDREDMFDNIKKWYTKEDNKDKYKILSTKLVSVKRNLQDMKDLKKLEPTELLKQLRESESIPFESISASLVRKLTTIGTIDAETGLKDEYAQQAFNEIKKIYNEFLSPEEIDNLYYKLKIYLDNCKKEKEGKKRKIGKKGGKTIKRKTIKRKTIKQKTIKRKIQKSKKVNIIKSKSKTLKKYNR